MVNYTDFLLIKELKPILLEHLQTFLTFQNFI
jgi:hypothetical protein